MRWQARLFLAFCGVLFGLAALVSALGYMAWGLTPREDASVARARAFERHMSGRLPLPDGTRMERGDVRGVPSHQVAEWPPEKGRAFAEAPMLTARVKSGDLPPVSERLPENPLVIVPPEQIGPYGGTWARFGNGPQDVGILEARLAYDGLVRWDAMSRTVLPNLAVRWDVEDEGRTYTFYLRKGVRWSDGHPFTAEDILFWYRHVLLNKELTPVVPRDYQRGGEVMDVEMVGLHAVRFGFKEPHGLFLYALASGRGYEMARDAAHYMKRFHPDFAPRDSLEALARTSGLDLWSRVYTDRREWRNPDMPRLWPWVMTQPPPAQPIVLTRNPYYWKVDPEGNQLPYIDRMTFDIFDNETINFKAINGEIGMQSRHLLFSNYPLFVENRHRGGYRMLHWVAGQGGELVLLPNLNHKDPVLRRLMNDRRFRQALSLAIDRDELNQVGYFGVGTPRQMAPPRTSAFYSPEYASAFVAFDPDEANRLLDALGLDRRDAKGRRLLPDGRPLSLTLEVATGSAILGLVVDHWTQVGVHTELRDLARPLWYQRVRAMMHDITAWSGSDEQNPLLDPRWFFPPDANAFHAPGYGLWYSTDGRAGVEPPGEIQACMALFRKIESETDPGEQVRLFREILELNLEHLWVIGLIGDIPSVFLVQDRFRNVPDMSVTGWSFRSPGNTAVECYAIEN